MRTFVTGPTGAGKTTYAKSLGRTYVDFDAVHGYTCISPEWSRSFLEELPHDCVVDAIPLDPTWQTFGDWVKTHTDTEIICICLSPEEWSSRPDEARIGKKTTSLWDNFWLMAAAQAWFANKYVDGRGDALTHQEAVRRVRLGDSIARRIENPGDHYDSRYQDIDEIGLIGYSGSLRSWETIKRLAEWEGRTVVDCGTFHGYFLFRISDERGSGVGLTGLDASTTAVDTARAINYMREDDVVFKEWQAGEPVPSADITLCLNSLHHFPDQEAFLASLASPLAIFEINTEQEHLLRGRWGSIDTFGSARPGRAIYRCHA